MEKGPYSSTEPQPFTPADLDETIKLELYLEFYPLPSTSLTDTEHMFLLKLYAFTRRYL